MAEYSEMSLEEVLMFDKKVLTFKGPYSKASDEFLTLENSGKQRIAYKLRLSDPNRYFIYPTGGIIEPNTRNTMQVTLYPCFWTAEYLKHKIQLVGFIVQDPDLAYKDVNWRQINSVMVTRLEVIYAFECPDNPNASPAEVAEYFGVVPGRNGADEKVETVINMDADSDDAKIDQGKANSNTSDMVVVAVDDKNSILSKNLTLAECPLPLQSDGILVLPEGDSMDSGFSMSPSEILVHNNIVSFRKMIAERKRGFWNRWKYGVYRKWSVQIYSALMVILPCLAAILVLILISINYKD